MVKLSRRQLVLGGFTLLGPASVLRAQESFPQRPIHLVLPFPAGSSVDIIARYLGPKVSSELGQPVIVENKAGAQGTIAAREVARAKPDGYVLLMGTNSTHAANVYMVKSLGYDPIKDFAPISQVTINPLMLVVRPEMPVNNLQDFLKYAKERPGKLNYGTANSGGLVAAQLMKSLSGIDALAVNYPGTAQAVTDLLGGRIDFIFTDPTVVKAFVDSGKLRVLGLTSKQRLASSPDVKPLNESGLPGYDYASWVGLFGPAGMPQDIVRRVNAAFLKALTEPDTMKFFSEIGLITAGSTPEALRLFVQQQIEVWGKLTRDAGVTPL